MAQTPGKTRTPTKAATAAATASATDDASPKNGTGPAKPEPEAGKLHYEASMSTGEAIAYFESVIEGLRKGSVQFRQGKQTLNLEPSARVDVEIKATRKGSKQKVSFEFAWNAASVEKLSID